MAHFAQLDEANVVMQVIVVNNETIDNLAYPQSEPQGIEFCQSLFGANSKWKQTSYNSNFRKNYAGIGYIYDADIDAFIPPKPYDSWLLNTTTCLWEAPIPKPETNQIYKWDEETLSWVSFSI